MAGRGPAPKLGPKLRHPSSAGGSRVVAPGDGAPKDWPLPPPPEAGWRPEAVDWWRAAVATESAAQAWTSFELVKLQRLMVMVDNWWRLTETSPTEAARQSDMIRRAEEELYLSPKARAQAGIVVEQASTRPPSLAGSARARLRAVTGDAVVED